MGRGSRIGEGGGVGKVRGGSVSEVRFNLTPYRYLFVWNRTDRIEGTVLCVR